MDDGHQLLCGDPSNVAPAQGSGKAKPVQIVPASAFPSGENML
jgi:hypothetical protein